MDTLTALKKRRSIRRFTQEPVDAEKLAQVMECARFYPTAATGAVRSLVQLKGYCVDTGACPILDGDTLYIGTVNNGVLALDAKTYEILRHYPVGKCLTYTSGYSKLDDGTVDAMFWWMAIACVLQHPLVTFIPAARKSD